MGTCRSRRICWHLDRDIERDLTGGPSDIESNASVIATDRRACCVRGSVADHAADRRDAAASAAVVIGLMQPAGRRLSAGDPAARSLGQNTGDRTPKTQDWTVQDRPELVYRPFANCRPAIRLQKRLPKLYKIRCVATGLGLYFYNSRVLAASYSLAGSLAASRHCGSCYNSSRFVLIVSYFFFSD